MVWGRSADIGGGDRLQMADQFVSGKMNQIFGQILQEVSRVPGMDIFEQSPVDACRSRKRPGRGIVLVEPGIDVPGQLPEDPAVCFGVEGMMFANAATMTLRRGGGKRSRLVGEPLPVMLMGLFDPERILQPIMGGTPAVMGQLIKFQFAAIGDQEEFWKVHDQELAGPVFLDGQMVIMDAVTATKRGRSHARHGPGGNSEGEGRGNTEMSRSLQDGNGSKLHSAPVANGYSPRVEKLSRPQFSKARAFRAKGQDGWHGFCPPRNCPFMKFFMPSRTLNEKGEERRAGFEFEFAGLNTEETAGLIRNLWGGKIERKNRFNVKISDSSLGDFSVEFDARMVKDEKYLEFLGMMGIDTGSSKERDWWEKLIENVANVAVPYEIGTPPIPFSRLEEVEKLRQAMLERDALGTKAQVQYAFGMHINPEIPDNSTDSVLGILRSFLVHHPFLLKELEVDLVRRVAPFIRPFTDDYLRLVLDPSYQPDRLRFVQDYLEHNPTRNRPLDLLPIFCLWDEDVIRKALPEEKVKARPAFHYRMPNCLFDDATWRVARDWNHWVAVENLADDSRRLNEESIKLLREMDESPLLWRSRWAERFGREVADA